ncbi:MAG: AfsR/SARP family transcriptional regulator [Vulcanimicrobiaceae bacterium]
MAGFELRFRFLGAFAVHTSGGWHGGPPPKRGRELLQLLGAYPRRVATCEALAEAFWPEVAPDAVAHRIHLSASGARAYLRDVAGGRELVRRVPGGYAWDAAADVRSDLRELLYLSLSESPDDLRSAVELYAGEFLAGETADWAQPLRVRCARAFEAAIEALAERAIKDRDYARALSYGLQLLDADPAHEAATRLSMGCFAKLGQRGRALECYDALRTYLRRTLSIEPTNETNDFASALRRRDAVEYFESETRALLV